MSKEMLYIPDKDLLEMYKNYIIGNKSYGEYCIEYKITLNGIISNCKEDQVIMVHIHAGFPQQKEDFAIVYKDSDAYRRLRGTDDYNVVVDINEHFEKLKNGTKNL